MEQENKDIEKKAIDTSVETAREQLAENMDQSYWGIVKRQFKKNRVAVWSLRFIIFIIVIGFTSRFIANDKPLICKIDGEMYSPVVKDLMVFAKIGKWTSPKLASAEWKTLEYDFAIWPIIPYGSTSKDKTSTGYVSPFDYQLQVIAEDNGTVERVGESISFKTEISIKYSNGDVKNYHVHTNKLNKLREGKSFEKGDLLIKGVPSYWSWHWLGTDEIGKDIFAGMIHGTLIAVLVGVIAMAIASFIGIFLGSMAGYFGDSKLKANVFSVVLYIVFFLAALFYCAAIPSGVIDSEGSIVTKILLGIGVFFGIMAIPFLLSMVISRIPFLNKKIAIPVDILVSRGIEILRSIPTLLLILSVVAVFDSSLFLVMAIIGLVSWTGIARFIRAELLRVRSLEYIEAAQSLGYSEARIIMRHAIPNALTPVLISIAFGVAGAILTESFLSFLGIGVPPDVITWGKLLSEARANFQAWWMAIFPGLAIFITVTLYNLLGEGLNDALDPKMKQ